MKVDPRTTLSVAVAVAAMAALTACGGGGATTSSAPAASAADAEVTVTATEFMFDPAALDLEVGASTTVELVNGGTVEHDFTIDDLDVRIYAGVGEAASDTVGPAEPGTYEYYCSIPGHREAGMVGELTVP